jgi:hypothetical protein
LSVAITDRSLMSASNCIPFGRRAMLADVCFRAWKVRKSLLSHLRRFQPRFLGSAVCPQGRQYLLQLRRAREHPTTGFIGLLSQNPPSEIPFASDSTLETSEGGRGPSTGPRQMESTITLRSRDTNKRNVPDGIPEEDERNQPK